MLALTLHAFTFIAKINKKRALLSNLALYSSRSMTVTYAFIPSVFFLRALD